jgi:O-methyltransferase involved in polyketide biosynthesis
LINIASLPAMFAYSVAMSEAPDTSRIIPTARYTGAVWVRHGLSPKGLGTRLGRALLASGDLTNWAYERLRRRPGLERALLLRHRKIDDMLQRAITLEKVSLVIEIAAGLSGRGYRLGQRFAERGLRYIEGDLPGMARRKVRMLEDVYEGALPAHHRVVTLNALADEGPHSIGSVISEHARAGEGVAIVTEGLLPYFDEATVRGMWRRFATALSAHAADGLYLADINLRSDGSLAVRSFLRLLSAAARGRVQLHFEHERHAEAALGQAGFATMGLHRLRDPRLGPAPAHIIEAST